MNARIGQRTVYIASALALLAWIGLTITNDAGPLGMLLGFAPRWWATLPWLLIVPIAFYLGRSTGYVSLAGALATILGIAHFELPSTLAVLPGRAPSRGDIRVVTYNTDLSASLAHRLREDVKRWNADVILLQDCKTVVADSLRAIFGVIAVRSRFCMASRWPMLDLADATSQAVLRDPRLRPYAYAVRVRLKSPYGIVPVYSVHLPSPRNALGAARWPQPRVLRPRLEHSLTQRGNASAAVSSAVSRSDAHFIVAGDFNLPFGSVILERDWSDLTNAFGAVGFGFGYTMQAGIFPVRIDHVLTPAGLEPVRARVLSGYPSEHQPVVVDLVWK